MNLAQQSHKLLVFSYFFLLQRTQVDVTTDELPFDYYLTNVITNNVDTIRAWIVLNIKYSFKNHLKITKVT